MAHKLPTYLRTYRKRAGLTQKEVAYLLGSNTEVKVSQYERMERKPSLHAALTLQIIFGVPAHELFPGLFKEVETLLAKQARLLSRQLENMEPRALTAHKVTFISSIASGKRGGPTHTT